MKIRTLIELLKKSKWFILFAILYSVYNLLESKKIDFESIIFLPFRYEGLLFFKNAMANSSKAFFFIRDWSTSFLPEEHPLLYFHNLDLVHFFAGFVQYFSSSGKLILFVLSLIVSLVGLWMVWKNLFNKYFNKLIAFILMALIIVPLSAFRVSPQNLFITLGLFSVVWNVILLRKIYNCEILRFKFFVELFCLFLLVAIVETNLAILLFMITGLFAFYSIKSPIKFNSIKRIFLITGISALPIILLRLVQLVSIYFYGYINKFMTDINYTSKLKVNSNIDVIDATAFYAQHGLTFFGQGAPQKISNNFKDLTSYYLNNYGEWIWVFVLILSLLFLVGNKIRFNKIFKNIDISQFQNNDVVFLSSYIALFVVASYLILFLSGDAIIKVFLSTYGIIDIDIVFRTFFIVLFPTVLHSIFQKKINVNNIIKRSVIVCLTLLATIFFIFAAKNSMLQTRKEYFGYKSVLSLVPEKSNVITNFEPSVVAIETKSRVNMSWFEKLPYSCSYLNSKSLLKMYKTNKEKYDNKNLYVFLVLYPPYGGEGKDNLISRHCIKPETHKLLYEDNLYILYKYIP